MATAQDVFANLFDGNDSDDDNVELLTDAKLENLFQDMNGTASTDSTGAEGMNGTDTTTATTTTTIDANATNGTEPMVVVTTTTTTTGTSNETGATTPATTTTTGTSATDMNTTDGNMTEADMEAAQLLMGGNDTGILAMDNGAEEGSNSTTNATANEESDATPTLPPGCSVTGGGNPWLAKVTGSNVLCNGTDVCRGSTINGCSQVTCGSRDCWGATMLEVGSVICEGESACYEAKIGTAARPATSVTCVGDEFTCYKAMIFASSTIQCEDNANGEGGQGICAFSELETPCLQCIGPNSGCNRECKLNGTECPDCRCSGTNCEGVCPSGEQFCRVENGTVVSAAMSSRYYSMVSLIGMLFVSMA